MSERSGTLGWALLGVGVMAWDVIAPETLSHAFQRGMESKYGRPLVLGGLGLTALHLVGALRPELDPFSYVPTSESRASKTAGRRNTALHLQQLREEIQAQF